jgi:hypothetical protein
MKLAIHNSNSGFHPRWIAYCKSQHIDFKLVDCYDTNLIHNLKDCCGLLWHHSQSNAKDILVAKQILFALEHTGFKVFPDYNTAWHFDDKVAQKYLLEAINAPMIPSFVFFNKQVGLEWADKTTFPKVFKLRGGAGSANVRLVRTKVEAKKLIQRSFGKGFKQYEAWSNLKERWRKYQSGKAKIYDVIKGVIRFVHEPEYSRIKGFESGYAYFQEFMPNNDFDIRIIVIDNKAFGLKRMVRENDFRASGSGNFKYDREEFDERCVKISFEVVQKLNSQCVAFDYIFDEKNNPLIVEISYGFVAKVYDPCPGYWDSKLNWHEGFFNAQGWMIEMMLKS